ncbi:MAG: hypothetical protein [Microviridae sp.]|nr:MAG: hypothetical protein [Microviridae sp.]
MKKDLLNTLMTLLLMFLVGGCMGVLVIYQSNEDLRRLNSKKEKKTTSNNNDVANSNQTPSGDKIHDTIYVTLPKHKNGVMCDTTSTKKAKLGRRTTQASHCAQ